MAKNRQKPTTIRGRLGRFIKYSMITALLSLILVLGIVSFSFQLSLTNELQDTETHDIEQQISIWYAERMAELRFIRETIENYDMTSDEKFELQKYLAHMLSKNELNGIYDYYIGMEDKTCYFGGGWEPAPGEYDPTTRDWYKNSMNSEDVEISEAYVDADSGRVVITMSLPIHVDGKVVGVLAADIFTDESLDYTCHNIMLVLIILAVDCILLLLTDFLKDYVLSVLSSDTSKLLRVK